MPANRLLRVNEKQISDVRATLGMADEDGIRRDVQMIVEWYEKQAHLPKVPLDADFVERMLIYRKGSVEQTKQKIDTLYTLRALPDMTSPWDPLHPRIRQTFDALTFAAMPSCNHDLTRVHMHRLTKNYEAFVIADTFKYIFMIIEYRLKHDYVVGEHYIYDLQNISLGHVAKVNPVHVKKAEVLLNAYGSRIFGFHFINAPPFMNTIMSIAKSVMSDKLFGRINVHSSIEDLHKVVSKNILPEEYGGDERPLDELAEAWKTELSSPDTRDYLLQQERLKADESLRIDHRPSDDMLGIPGSFKLINVD